MLTNNKNTLERVIESRQDNERFPYNCENTIVSSLADYFHNFAKIFYSFNAIYCSAAR